MGVRHPCTGGWNTVQPLIRAEGCSRTDNAAAFFSFHSNGRNAATVLCLRPRSRFIPIFLSSLLDTEWHRSAKNQCGGNPVYAGSVPLIPALRFEIAGGLDQLKPNRKVAVIKCSASMMQFALCAQFVKRLFHILDD